MSKSKRRARKSERTVRKDNRRNEKQRRKEAARDKKHVRKIERMNLRGTNRTERVRLKQQANIEKEQLRSDADKVAYQNGVDPVSRGNTSFQSDGGGSDAGGIWGTVKNIWGGIFGGKGNQEAYEAPLPEQPADKTFMGLSMPQMLIGIGVIAALIMMFKQGEKQKRYGRS